MDFMSFLNNARNLIHWRPIGGLDPIYIVLSHESCDLDSVVSTLGTAYLRHSNSGATQYYMPMLNMLRRDYASRTEVRFLLDQQQITAEHHLVFRDDVSEDLLLHSRFILVNHHVSPFHYCTDEVYDYRPYRCEAARLPVDCQRIMRPMNSCAALITDLYSSPIYNYANVQCLRVYELLHAGIILQNNNFAQFSAAQLPSVSDFQQLLFLENHLGTLNVEQRTILYDTLVNAMFNLNELSMPQILRREFKLLRANNGSHLVRIAQCCFPMAVTRFISFEFSQLALQKFAAEHNCDFIILLGTSMQPKGGLSIKEIGLIPLDTLRDVEDRRLFEHLIINLNATVDPLLSLEPYRCLNFMQGTYYYINEWSIQFYDMLNLMQRIVYNWIYTDKKS